MKKGESSSRLRWCLKAPFRAMRRALDFYVRSMTGCADGMHQGAAAVSYPAYVGGVPRSYSLKSSRSEEEDLRDLIRAASRRQPTVLIETVRKSQSVAVGRIDEDSPCEFIGSVGVGNNLLFPRKSRSLAGAGAKGRLGVIA